MKRTTPPQYTYRQGNKKEDLKTYRKIALVILAFFAVLLIIWFMGTSFINALGLLAKGNSSDNNTIQSDNLPLLTPKIDPKLPDSINQDNIAITGNSTANINISLIVNGKSVETQKTDDQGNFNFKDVELTDGLNLIKLVAKNSQGEEKQTEATITLDKTKPSLVISSPVDGTSFPSSQKQVSVSGNTEAENLVYINGSQAVVGGDGRFSYSLTLQAGANEIEVKAIDPAGNTETIKVTVNVDSGQ